MPSESASEVLSNVVRTLLINGYSIDSFDQPCAGVWIINVRKLDVLGAQSRAVLLFSPDVSEALRQRVSAEAQRYGGLAISVNTGTEVLSAGERLYMLSEFFALLGGEAKVDRILRADLKSTMIELGHNRLPAGFIGTADDLLEDYSKECFQFLLECPVRRYGQERKFEKRPDGLALGRRGMNFFYDSKAYGDRFHPTADDIRRFASYVDDFNNAYAAYVGRISTFIVISGSFSTDRNAILEKSNDLFAMCHTPLSFIAADDLAEMVQLSCSAGRARGAIDWKRVLVPGLVEISRLRSELSKVDKDRIVTK